MSDWRYWNTDKDGLRRDWRPDGNGGVEVRLSQDVGGLIEQNKAAQNHNDGYSPSRDIRRAASIPASVGLKWLIEEGWWFQDPQYADRLVKKLNDPDWAHLRTAPGIIGLSNGIAR